MVLAKQQKFSSPENRNNGKRDMIYRKGLQFGRALDKEVRGVYQKKKIQSEEVGWVFIGNTWLLMMRGSRPLVVDVVKCCWSRTQQKKIEFFFKSGSPLERDVSKVAQNCIDLVPNLNIHKRSLDSYACPDQSRRSRTKLANIYTCKIFKTGGIFWEEAQGICTSIKMAAKKALFSCHTTARWSHGSKWNPVIVLVDGGQLPLCQPR